MRVNYYEFYKRRLNENNPIGKDINGDSIYEYATVSEIPNELFKNPSYSVLLPEIPKFVENLIGFKNRKVLLKKKVILKTLRDHSEIELSMHKKILTLAVYNPTVFMKNKPISKPNYLAFVNEGDYYAVSTIDFDETKKYIEIVDWRKVDSKEFDRMIRKVSAEGGQFLIKAVDR
ncbi:hypothetical protein TRSA_11500 [Treponema saccharophilum]|uniref:Large polyvalent protein-associated domain-containing protein n=1 Tax=Treponema saccharophilum DSM 2985 TaxID=907348 RepID=H7EGU3_9SPIR|nr:hypothetical protein TresaDRAFT_0434 [Treponema saccharophilum DSM 2985]EIC03199.1 hypothetical protein TresaDRAFT_2831 [Treponema saccharophilum DSM 2985]BDC96051.1 hypothetical protein TRSA_11500 [Treponema saccharophilum]